MDRGWPCSGRLAVVTDGDMSNDACSVVVVVVIDFDKLLSLRNER